MFGEMGVIVEGDIVLVMGGLFIGLYQLCVEVIFFFGYSGYVLVLIRIDGMFFFGYYYYCV